MTLKCVAPCSLLRFQSNDCAQLRLRPPAPGYAMVALLVAMSVMAVMLGLALPVWQTAIRREREAELVFRGEQYVQAIRLFQRRYAGTFPPNVNTLVEQRFLRRRYQDPISGGDFQLVYAGTGPGTVGTRAAGTLRPATSLGRGGIIGVVSKSTETSLRLYNGRGHYNEWTFVVTGAPVPVTTKDGMLATREHGHAGRRRAPEPNGMRRRWRRGDG